MGLYGTGPMANDSTVNSRTLQDLNLQLSIALPAANASATSAILDTANVNPGRIDDVELFISVPATPNLTNTDTFTVTLQDSDDGVTFGNTVGATVLSVTGGGGGGAAAQVQFKPPINIGRYLQIVAAVPNGGGNNTAVAATFGFLF